MVVLHMNLSITQIKNIKMKIPSLFFCFSILCCIACENSTKEKSELPGIVEKDKTTSESIDTLLNTKDYLVLGKKTATVGIVDSIDYKPDTDYAILWSAQNRIIIGKNTSDAALEIYQKYRYTKSFEDYAASLYTGTLAAPNFASNPKAKQFKTVIKEGCSKGINFAGYYTLITWGCGSSCQTNVVVNRKNGDIHDYFVTASGIKFKPDSKLIITNIAALDTIHNLIFVGATNDVHQEVWTGNDFKKIEVPSNDTY